MITLAQIFLLAQVFVGGCIALGAMLVLKASVDRRSPHMVRWFFVELVVSGAWFALDPFFTGHVSSRPAILLAGVVAWAVLFRGRTIRQLVDGYCRGRCRT